MCKYLRDFSPEQMAKIANTYADSKLATRALLADQFDTTKETVTQILTRCIEGRLIPLDSAVNVAKRATRNAAPYNGDVRTRKHYSNLLRKAYGINLDDYIWGKKTIQDDSDYLRETELAQQELNRLKSLLPSCGDYCISDEDGSPTFESIESKIYHLERYLA